MVGWVRIRRRGRWSEWVCTRVRAAVGDVVRLARMVQAKEMGMG